MVIAGAKGIVQTMDRTWLAEYGGPTSLTRGWANSILERMNFTGRAKEFEECRTNFLQEVIDIVTMENIPPY